MKLTLFNGSPRGKKSTTTQLLNSLKTGFLKTQSNNCSEYYIKDKRDEKLNSLTFVSSDIVIIAFPLYTDSMPGIVKEFIEDLKAIRGMNNLPTLGFLVQSGFPEAKQSYYVERYCKKLTKRLGCNYLGTIIKGNCNRVEEQPKFMTKQLFNNFEKLGEILGNTGKLDDLLIKKILIPETLSTSMRFILKLINLTPLGEFYWKKELKKNGQYKMRFATPYS